MDHTSSDKIANDGPEKSVQELENEIKRLKKQLRRSQLETEILKKRTSTLSSTASKICFY